HYFACRRFFAMGACPAPAYISDVRLDPCVEAIVFGLLARRRRPPLAQLQQTESRAARAQAAPTGYRDSHRVLALLGERAFDDGLSARVERLRLARLELAATRDRVAAHQLEPAAQVKARWPSMAIAERRDLIADVIDVVFVRPGARDPLADRVMACPAGTAP